MNDNLEQEEFTKDECTIIAVAQQLSECWKNYQDLGQKSPVWGKDVRCLLQAMIAQAGCANQVLNEEASKELAS
jgi:hypothetical protein